DSAGKPAVAPRSADGGREPAHGIRTARRGTRAAVARAWTPGDRLVGRGLQATPRPDGASARGHLDEPALGSAASSVLRLVPRVGGRRAHRVGHGRALTEAWCLRIS